jgi:hypothetical protein
MEFAIRQENGTLPLRFAKRSGMSYQPFEFQKTFGRSARKGTQAAPYEL